MAPRYLKQVDTGRIYPYSPHIADRADMVEYTPEEGEFDKKPEEEAPQDEAPGEKEPEVDLDAEAIAGIENVTTLEDLAKFRIEGRSEAVENAINKKGMELFMAGVKPVGPNAGPEDLKVDADNPEAAAERIEKIKAAVASIPSDQYGQSFGGRPAMPKVGDVSDKAGFKVSAEEIMLVMTQQG